MEKVIYVGELQDPNGSITQAIVTVKKEDEGFLLKIEYPLRYWYNRKIGHFKSVEEAIDYIQQMK